MEVLWAEIILTEVDAVELTRPACEIKGLIILNNICNELTFNAKMN